MVFKLFQLSTSSELHFLSMQELDSSAEFDAARDANFSLRCPRGLPCLPSSRAKNWRGAKPYLLRTANLRQRLARLLGPPEAGRSG
jgi:hypothetical protein